MKGQTGKKGSDAGGGLPYLLFAGLFTQSETNDPTPTVVLNQLSGPVVWTRNTGGVYYGTLAGAFLLDKVVILGSGACFIDEDTLTLLRILRLNDNTITFSTFATATLLPKEANCFKLPFEFHIFP